MFVPLKALIHCTETLPNSLAILFGGGNYLMPALFFVLNLLLFSFSRREVVNLNTSKLWSCYPQVEGRDMFRPFCVLALNLFWRDLLAFNLRCWTDGSFDLGGEYHFLQLDIISVVRVAMAGYFL